jgi:glutathione S-transferase
MAITLYDLAGADPDLRFSPYCWRTRMALAHKDLPVKRLPWRFTDKTKIKFSGQEKVPVIKDGTTTVADSWTIAEYLEETYSERPSLFGGSGGVAHAFFINAWADTIMLPGIGRLIVRDIWALLDPKDQDYFRTTREKQFGATLESITADRDKRVADFRHSLFPIRRVLKTRDWLGGDEPSYADYIVFGQFQWARCTSTFELLTPDDPVTAWRTRMLDLFGNLAGSAKTAADLQAA